MRLRLTLPVAAALASAVAATMAQAHTYASPSPYPPPAASAYPPPMLPPSGARRHEGLFFRFALAPGVAAMTAETGGVTSKITTTQRELRPSLGYALSDNVILFGAMVVHESYGSTATIADLAPARKHEHPSFSGLGVGTTYYWMPVNVYVSAALLTVHAYSDGTIGTTKRGGGLDLALGKEWWVYEGIGLGIAAQVLVASMREKLTTVQGEKPTWNRMSASLGFSATFN